ncbi:SURF1 family cytochrome oxidase biogenesis protein [Actinomadura sp. BRA 177]|uniref:SURF1 family cytochrome oxidase biogenesis protein n=1 Tax=Actinomadura sp. BRA 177 TaxID=2745202 RepID=UPI0034D9692A
MRDGKAGVELLQPFHDQASGLWLLLNRGWLPWRDAPPRGRAGRLRGPLPRRRRDRRRRTPRAPRARHPPDRGEPCRSCP